MAPYTLERYAAIEDLNDILAQLSTAEKISLLAGPDWWTTTEIPRIGVPHIKCSDGPNGVRGSSHFLPTPAQCIPCATALGATFNTELLKEVGGLLARECRAKGSSLILAPTCNIQRNPLNGRAFESFSEDPHLSGMIAAHYVLGLQADGVGATIKHFVCNDMEHERLSVDVIVGERALREIYLMPFMIAQKLAKPWGFMTSYSRMNGVHCSEDKRLLQEILREEWGFDGMVMSDWSGTYSTDLAVNAGLDLEMPGPTRWRGAHLNHLMHAGKVEMEALDARAYAILQVVQRAVRGDIELVRANTQPERQLDDLNNNAINRRVAGEAIVLLKNDKSVLPINLGGVKKLAVIGPNVKTRTVSGGGSAFMTSSYVVTPLEGILAACEGSDIDVVYKPGCYSHRYLPMLDGWIRTASGDLGWTADFYNDNPDNGAPLLSSHTLVSTRLRINDEKPKDLAEFFYITITGYIVAEETGVFELGLSLVGRAQLFVNGKMIIDNGINCPQTPGPSFYGLGTIEETGTFDFVKGERYELTVKYTNVPLPVTTPTAKQPPLMMAALRVGGAPLIDPRNALEDAVALAKDCDAVVCVIGLNMDWEAEASDREGLALPGLTDELVERLLAVNGNTVVVNQSGSAVAFPWVDKAPTLVQAWFAGNECGNAMADVLFGKVNPAGRLPLTFPKRIEDCTAHLNWGAENGKVLYGEGIFVGYRGYEETKREPMFHFGHGLSYTSFEWSSVSATVTTGASPDDLKLTVSLTVTNTGTLPGSEVVQIYITDLVSSYRRPKRELKGFAKTASIAPREEETIKVVLGKEAFAYYDDKKSAWVAEKGAFGVLASRSADSESVQSHTEVVLERTWSWRGL